jgi:hypothetical protein
MNKKVTIKYYKMRKPIIKAIIRTDKADKKTGECPICIQIRLNGDKKRISIGEKIHPSHWDTDAGRAIGKGYGNLNKMIDKRKNDLEEFCADTIIAGYQLSFSDIDKFLNGTKNSNLYDVFDSVMEIKKPKICDDTKYKYATLRSRLKAFQPRISTSNKQREVFKDVNKVRRRHLVKKIAKNNSIVRIELRVKRVSQFNRASIKSKIRTLESIRKSFDLLGKELYKLFVNISFVDEISPDINRNLVRSQLDSKNVSAFNEYLQFLGLKSFGVVRFVDFAYPILNTNIRNSYIQKLENIYNQYKGDNDYIRKEFQRKVSSKINKLIHFSISGSN